MPRRRRRVSLQSGVLLLAEPFMLDPNFRRTVVYIVKYEPDEGAFGTILNRPLEITVGQAVEDFRDLSVPLYFGGPVQQESIYFIHRIGESLRPGLQLFEDTYWGGDFEQLRQFLITQEFDESQLRFYIGYAGWAPQQLERELETNSWIVTNAFPEDIFHLDGRDLWKKIMEELGGHYKVFARAPEHPMLN